MSWGSPNKEEKFYKGAKNDTAWNKDLLWKYHVAKEVKQTKVNAGEIPCSDPSLKMRHVRMRMGITGTLIPDATPRYDANETAGGTQVVLHSSSSRSNLRLGDCSGTRSTSSRARSIRSTSSSGSQKSSVSGGSLPSSSSMRSIRLQDVQEILESQSRLLKEKTDEEIAAMKSALEAEARKREAAEKKLLFLCEKLGVEGK